MTQETYKPFFLFVEGVDDERFMDCIFRARLLASGYSEVNIIKYRKKQQALINKQVAVVKKITLKHPGANYLFVGDLDDKDDFQDAVDCLCIKYSNLDENRVYIVIKEIESWYLAGVDGLMAANLEVKNVRDTERIDKEFFITRGYTITRGRTLTLLDCLENFKPEVAARKNNSFSRFIGLMGWGI